MRILFLMTMLLSITVNAKIRVAVIDTGFLKVSKSNVHLCGKKDLTGTTIYDRHGHGSHITNTIDITARSDRSKYCFIIIKAFSKKSKNQYVTEALEYLIKVKPDIINISAGGFGAVHRESMAVKKLLNAGTIIVAAAGNDNTNLNKKCNYYPACYDKRIVVVGNVGNETNYGKVVDVVINGNNINVFGRIMSGSSQSTAIFTGRMLRNLIRDKKKRK